MKKYLEVLKKCTLFAGIKEQDLEALMGCLGARVIHCGKKETVIAEGEEATQIGIVLKGSVQVQRVDYFGNRSIVSGAGEGEVFAESFACADVREIPVSVVTNESSDLLLLERDRILHPCCNACGFHQQLIFNLMKDIAGKNLLFHQKLEVTSKRTTREKLMAYLLLQAKRAGKEQFSIPFDRQELADYLEVDRSGLSAEISKLRKEGILECRKNQFKLL